MPKSANLGSRQKQKRLSVGALRDGHEDKRFPNSIAALVRGIYKSWLNRSNPDKYDDNLSAVDFVVASNFGNTYTTVVQKFAGIKRPRRKEFHDFFNNLGAGKDSAFPYYEARAISDYLGISESTLFLYTKLMSIERRVDDPTERKAALLQIVSAMKRAVIAAEHLIESDEGGGKLFSLTDSTDKDGNSIWVADIDRLKFLCDQYNSGNLELVRKADHKP